MNIPLGMPFSTLSNVKNNFVDCDLHLTKYIIVEILLTTRQLKQIDKKKFAATALNLEDESFIDHVTSIS